MDDRSPRHPLLAGLPEASMSDLTDQPALCRGRWVNPVLDRVWDRLEAAGASESLSIIARMSEEEFRILAWLELRDPRADGVAA